MENGDWLISRSEVVCLCVVGRGGGRGRGGESKTYENEVL